MTLNQRTLTALTALALIASAPAVAGTQNLLTNGSFESSTATQSGQKLGTNTLTGWTAGDWFNNGVDQGTGYNFLYTGDVINKGLPLYGPIPYSPDGGNFVGMDGVYENGTLSQTVNGLTAGQLYYVSFYWAGAQQNGTSFTSATTEQFAVSFTAGSTAPAPSFNCATAGVQCTGILHDAPESFTGWNFAGFTFKATSSTETLAFLALGTPTGQPPFSLLDGVSVEVPEPSSYVVACGLGLLLAARWRRRRVLA